MEAEDLLFNYCCEGQVIEEVGEVFPHIGVSVLAEALVVETIDLGDLARLVVASEDGDSVLEADLQADEQGHGLY